MISTVNGLEYNSQRANLTISEHGRHVQKLIKHAKTIEDREERQAFVEKVIDLMHQIHPQHKNVEEYRLRLWRHVFRIAEYDLDVTPPEEVASSAQEEERVVVDLPYPQKEFRFRHYGRTIQKMVAKAVEMEDEEKKEGFTIIIAEYMKLAYRTWNREHYVNDEIIKADLLKVSKGKLSLSEEHVIATIAGPTLDRPMPLNTKSRGKKNRNNNNNNGKNRNKNNKNNNRNRKRK